MIHSHTHHHTHTRSVGAKIINEEVDEHGFHDTLKSSECRDKSEMMKIEWKLSGKLRA